MDRPVRNYLEQKLILIRRSMLELGKFGMSDIHYETELKKVEDNARLARAAIEFNRKQGRLIEPETTPTPTAN